MMEEITITEFTNADRNYLAEMIHEKLIEMGYEAVSFSFDLIVSIDEDTQ